MRAAETPLTGLVAGKVPHYVLPGSGRELPVPGPGVVHGGSVFCGFCAGSFRYFQSLFFSPKCSVSVVVGARFVREAFGDKRFSELLYHQKAVSDLLFEAFGTSQKRRTLPPRILRNISTERVLAA